MFLTQLHMCEHMQVYIFSTEGKSSVSRRIGWNEKSHGLNASLCNMLHSLISFILYVVKSWQLCWKITETVLVVIQQTFKSCFGAHLKGRWWGCNVLAFACLWQVSDSHGTWPAQQGPGPAAAISREQLLLHIRVPLLT